MERRNPLNKYHAILDFLEKNWNNKSKRTFEEIRKLSSSDNETTNNILKPLLEEDLIKRTKIGNYEITFKGLDYLNSIRDKKLRISVDKSVASATVAMVIATLLISIQYIFPKASLPLLILIGIIATVLLLWIAFVNMQKIR